MSDNLKIALGVVAAVVVVGGMIAAMESGERHRAEVYEQQRIAEWERPCADTTVLVATSAGSPSEHTCTNKRHKMRVEVKSLAGEEVGAVVMCECQPEAK